MLTHRKQISKMGPEVEKAAKTAFLQLRPICSAAANIPNVTNFTALLTALEDVEVICFILLYSVWLTLFLYNS